MRLLRCARFVALLVAAALTSPFAQAQGQLNLYCSSPNTAWCQGMAVGFERATGTHVAVVQKATGESVGVAPSTTGEQRASPSGGIPPDESARPCPPTRRQFGE